MSKSVLIVSTAAQAALFNEVLKTEIMTGFWAGSRPTGHGEAWGSVTAKAGTELGPQGFEAPRTYNFLNPDFYPGAKDRLIEAGKTVDAEYGEKQLKRDLTEMSRIVGGRIKTPGGEITKLARGRKTGETVAATPKTSSTVRRVAAKVAEPPAQEAPAQAPAAEASSEGETDKATKVA